MKARGGEAGVPLLRRMAAMVAGAICLATITMGAAGQESVGPPPLPSPSDSEGNVSIEGPSDDEAIDERLTRILVASGWFDRPSVEVREGIVFLDGAAGSDEQREWAAALARRTDGVVAVVNRIGVESAVNWNFRPAWDEVQRLAYGVQRAIPIAVIGLVILVITWLLAKWASRLMRWVLRDRITSPLMLSVTARAFAVPVFILGLYLVLQISGLTNLAITVLGGTGLAGIVIGFAFRDIAENFLASLLLSIRNPFRAGDLVKVGDHEEIVTNLNTRSTVLLTLDGNHIQIPNGAVFKSVIVNYSSNPSRRAEFTVGIGYDDPTSRAQSIIEEVLRAHPAVREDPSPFVVVDELAASTVNLRVYFWFDSTLHSPAKLRSALMRQTKHRLLAGGISMPDEAREVIFPQGVPIYRQPGGAGTVTAPSVAEAELPGESDASSAEGGLGNEDEDVLREAGAVRTPEEGENLLKTGARPADGPAPARTKGGR